MTNVVFGVDLFLMACSGGVTGGKPGKGPSLTVLAESTDFIDLTDFIEFLIVLADSISQVWPDFVTGSGLKSVAGVLTTHAHKNSYLVIRNGLSFWLSKPL